MVSCFGTLVSEGTRLGAAWTGDEREDATRPEHVFSSLSTKIMSGSSERGWCLDEIALVGRATEVPRQLGQHEASHDSSTCHGRSRRMHATEISATAERSCSLAAALRSTWASPTLSKLKVDEFRFDVEKERRKHAAAPSQRKIVSLENNETEKPPTFLPQPKQMPILQPKNTRKPRQHQKIE